MVEQMRIGVFKNGPYGMRQVWALAHSFEDLGNELVDCTEFHAAEIPTDLDAAIVFGEWYPAHFNIFPPKIVLVVEQGFFLREEKWLDRRRFSVTFDRMLNVPKTVYKRGFNVMAELERTTQLLPTFEPKTSTSNRILVLGQMPGDKAHEFKDNPSMISWLRKQVKSSPLKGGKVIYRPHPKSLDLVTHGNWKLDTSCNLEHALATHRPKLVVTYNSTAGLLAACDGWNVLCSPKAWYHGLDKFVIGMLALQSSFTMHELLNGTAAKFLMETRQTSRRPARR